MRRSMRALPATLAATLLAACGPADQDEERTAVTEQALAHPGPWEIPAETLAIGDEQDVVYTGAGDWVGEAGCGGGILSGTDILRDYLYAHFPQTYEIGGYSCRPINGNPSKMSVHATGRALDTMLALDDGEADNDAGDPIGNWLIENAEAIGIQYVIWDLYTWQAERPDGAKGKPYGGAHPHHDHLHIELSVERADEVTNWFEDVVTPPVIEGCAPLPFSGGVVDNDSECFVTYGPAQFWRQVDDGGYEGSLVWTNAYESDNPSNWARWNVVLSARGAYDVEVYVDPEWGTHHATRYGIVHAGVEDTVEIDQSTQNGWVSLGEFDFEAGAEQHVSVYDNASGPVEPDQHIAVDAVRLTRIGGYPPPRELGGEGAADDDEGGGSLPEDDPGGTSSSASADEGCSLGAAPGRSSSGRSALLLGLGVAVLVSRRRRAR
jgi:hypothetical protein